MHWKSASHAPGDILHFPASSINDYDWLTNCLGVQAGSNHDALTSESADMLLILGDEDAETHSSESGGALLRIGAVLELGKAVCRTSKVCVAVHYPLHSSTYYVNMKQTLFLQASCSCTYNCRLESY